MSLPIAILCSCIFIAIYGVVWPFILKHERNKRGVKFNWEPMTKEGFKILLIIHIISAFSLAFGAIYISYFN
ncbi:hypothetical protein SEQU_13160 (plasmid) [Staphylococcus equorum UMC-CNS-924]|nr:hypothetical protein SEQU_13160 [Staphylococcus equorum UMC-CNS-924]